MKAVRPKLSPGEIQLILEATEKAGYNKMYGTPQGALHHRFSELSKGRHIKKRFYHGLPVGDRLYTEAPKKCPKCGAEDSFRPLLSHDTGLRNYLKCKKCAYEILIQEEA